MRPASRSVSRALETVAHLDAHLPLVFRDEEDDAVIEFLLSDFPLFRDLDGEFLDGDALEVRHGEDGDLRGVGALELREFFFDIGLRGG